MPATWLIALAWVALATAFASAADILLDIYGRGYRQKMPITEAVWPVTALYFGPAASWAYRRFGRPMGGRARPWRAAGQAEVGQPPRLASATEGRAARSVT